MITQFPIVIIASPRTGSSAYCRYLADTYNLSRWQEPDLVDSKFLDFKNQLATGTDKYVLKIMAWQIEKNTIYQSILANNCYKIRLTRENKIEQLVSHYIGWTTKIWNSENKFARGEKYAVGIDRKEINDIIVDHIKYERSFDKLDIKFDEEHTYEELLKTVNLNATGMQKIIPPTNYIFLKRVIEQEYDKYR